MKDLANIELQEGDLILDIRTNLPSCKICRVQGGQTPTGKVRFVMWTDYKGSSPEHCILKITSQHAREVLDSTKRVYVEMYGLPPWNFHYEVKFQMFINQLEQIEV